MWKCRFNSLPSNQRSGFAISGKREEVLASLTLHSGHTDGWWACHISSASRWAPSRVCQPETGGCLPTPGWESQSLQPHRYGQLAPAPNTVASPHCCFCAPPVRVTIPPNTHHPNQNKTRVTCSRCQHWFMYAYFLTSGSQGNIYHPLQLAFCSPCTKWGFTLGSELGEVKNCSMFGWLLYTQQSWGNAPWIKARARGKTCRSSS